MKPSKAKKTNSTLRGILICMILLMMVISGGIASIHAYFTDSDSIVNTLTLGENVISIATDERVVVENEKSVDYYIRVFVAPERPETVLPEPSTAIDPADGEAYWTKSGDYYYFKNPVAPGYTTKQLFDRAITGGPVIVYAESIQAEVIADNAIEAFSEDKKL